jgi:hypothetical protein
VHAGAGQAEEATPTKMSGYLELSGHVDSLVSHFTITVACCSLYFTLCLVGGALFCAT